jgi:hypothetical protein
MTLGCDLLPQQPPAGAGARKQSGYLTGGSGTGRFFE